MKSLTGKLICLCIVANNTACLKMINKCRKADSKQLKEVEDDLYCSEKQRFIDKELEGPEILLQIGKNLQTQVLKIKQTI